MKHVPKETTDDALIQEILNKGGKVNFGKTKSPAAKLGLRNNQWNNKLTREEKVTRGRLRQINGRRRTSRYGDRQEDALCYLFLPIRSPR